MNISRKPSMLMILDGFGINSRKEGNAVAEAKTPNLDRIFSTYPGTEIAASGEAVGLPEGQMGNSEVGHLNIGAGRIVYQDLTRITKAIEDESFFNNSALCKAMDYLIENDSALHLMGLLSDGGVHSHIKHLFALVKMAAEKGIKKVYIHCFLDGRDVPPRCAKKYIEQLEEQLKKFGVGEIVTIEGRYYAMDRDKRFDRVKLAYDAMVLREGRHSKTAEDAIDLAYEKGENDEFVLPTCVGNKDDEKSHKGISDNDGIVMFNFRPDRAREITRALVDPEFSGFERAKLPRNIAFVCMTCYDDTIPNVDVAYPPEHLDNTLGEYLSKEGLKQLRIAETEKYAHVTFFFNGGVEEPNKGEDRILIPSPKVATYDLQPEMSAYEVTDKVIEEIDRDYYDCIILNFANADMVGHTGIMEAAIKAVETLDQCVPKIVEAVLSKGGQILLTADHGNADVMEDEKGNTVTAHSLNPVPLYHIAEKPSKLKAGGKLADVAPTLLSLMGLPVPKEMTGKNLAEI